ncbi:unnamed protein product [Aphanomyces euteiches]
MKISSIFGYASLVATLHLVNRFARDESMDISCVQEDIRLHDEQTLMEPESSPPAQETPDAVSAVDSTTENASKRKRDDPIMCIMCSSADIKYRCPRCERITCSLVCCLAHKKNFECDGKRDRTKYIPLAQFRDADISSDFFFLQEVARSTSAVHLEVDVKPAEPKKPRRHEQPATALSVNPELPANYLRRYPPSVQSFVQQAKKRGIFVHLHAAGMSKRKANTSFYNSKQDCIYWRLEVNFIHSSGVRIVEPKYSEALSLEALMEKHLSVSLENAPLRAQLKKYCKLPTTEWLFLLKKEFVAASTPQYYELNSAQSLAENLRHLSIVEFPVVLVTLAANRNDYSLAHRAIEVVVPAQSQVPA